jgi:hypothetical protein
MAWLEAMSVLAFCRLARELRAHGAPEELVRASLRAAGDEVAHARIMRALARRRGEVTIPLRIEIDSVVRPLESIARENAIEGCVNETFGAILATWHARHGKDAAMREAMRRIAPDELRHAALAWAIAAWSERRLSAGGRSRVEVARADAIAERLACAGALERRLMNGMLTRAVWRRAA